MANFPEVREKLLRIILEEEFSYIRVLQAPGPAPSWHDGPWGPGAWALAWETQIVLLEQGQGSEGDEEPPSSFCLLCPSSANEGGTVEKGQGAIRSNTKAYKLKKILKRWGRGRWVPAILTLLGR